MMMKFLLDPRTWVVLVIVGVTWFFVHTFEQNKQFKIELDNQQDKIVLLQKETDGLRAGQEILKEDISRLDEIAANKQKIIIREVEIRRELSEIPKTIDAPFADDNNLAYARRLRQHQHDTLSDLT